MKHPKGSNQRFPKFKLEKIAYCSLGLNRHNKMIEEKSEQGQAGQTSARCDAAMGSSHSGAGAAQAEAHFLRFVKYSCPHRIDTMVF